VLEANEGSVKPLAEVRAQLKRDVQMARALDALFELANGMEDLLAGGATVEEAARELNLNPSKIDAIDAQGGLPAGTGGTAPALGGQFLTTAFQTEVGAQSDLIEDDGNRYFILRVDGVTPAAVQPLAAVESEVAAAWRAEAQLKAAEAIAGRIEKAIAGGQNFAAAVTAENLTVTEVAAFTRAGEGLPSGLPAEFAEVVFELKGDAIGQSADDAQVAVVRLTGVVPADPEKDQEAIDALADQLTGEVARDALQLFVAGLRQSREVSIDRAAIDARIKSPHNDYNP
ncbi:MAG: peptidyl-prolyl cis-trans isomerase, partial [Thalassobaculaceae bacterium]